MSKDFTDDDTNILLELLKRPIAYHQCFALMTGSIAAGVMLSQAYYWNDRIEDRRDGWFYKTQQDWHKETALTRTEQENARKKLKLLGILEEKKEGVPCKLYFRINKKKLISCLRLYYNPVCGFAADCDEAKPQTEKLKSRKQASSDLTDNLYTEITPEITNRDYTEKEKEADFFFSENQALQDDKKSDRNANIHQDPIPPTPLSRAPEVLPKKVYADPMGDRMRSGKKSNRFAPMGLELAGFGEWHLGDRYNNWRGSLVEAAKVRKKALNQKADNPAAQDYIKNLATQSHIDQHWGKFENLVDEAQAIEQADRRVEQTGHATKAIAIVSRSKFYLPTKMRNNTRTGESQVVWDRFEDTGEIDPVKALNDFIGKYYEHIPKATHVAQRTYEGSIATQAEFDKSPEKQELIAYMTQQSIAVASQVAA